MNKKELLEMPVWTYKEVMLYCNVKKSKAYEIIKTCKEKLNGSVRFNTHGVKRNSVLEYMGTSIEQEAYVLKNVIT